MVHAGGGFITMVGEVSCFGSAVNAEDDHGRVNFLFKRTFKTKLNI
jgi:hypothetical protein